MPRAGLFAVGEKNDYRRPVAEIERIGGNGNRARERRLTVRLQRVDLAHDAPGGIGARRQFEVDILALAVAPRTEDDKSKIPNGRNRREHACKRATNLLNSRHGVFAEAHAGHRARGIEDDHGVGFAFRRTGARRHGWCGSRHAEEQRPGGAEGEDDRGALVHH